MEKIFFLSVFLSPASLSLQDMIVTQDELQHPVSTHLLLEMEQSWADQVGL